MFNQSKTDNLINQLASYIDPHSPLYKLLKTQNTHTLTLSDTCLRHIKRNTARRLAMRTKENTRHNQALQAQLCAFISGAKSNTACFDTDSVTVILDTGASAGFTHCLSDFISFREISGEVNGLGAHKIKGIGTVKYFITTDKGTRHSITIRDVFFVPTIKERLLSPQQIAAQYSRSGRSCFVGDGNCFQLYWDTHCKTVYLHKGNNLPILHTAPGSSKASAFVSKCYTTTSIGPLCFACDKTIEAYPANTDASSNDPSSSFPHETVDFVNGPSTQDPTQHIHVKCKPDCPSCRRGLPSQTNTLDLTKAQTLTEKQKILLWWHERLGHIGWARLKRLAELGYLHGDKSLAKVDPPVCLGCVLGKAHNLPKGKGSLKGPDIKDPGDLIHTDQAETSQPGRPLTFSGKNNSKKITCFTVYVDTISHFGFVHFQHSTSAEETLKGKHRFERYAQQYGRSIKNLRSDNGVFRSKEIRLDLLKNGQDITFAAVGAKHQNGVAERFIRTITERARSALLHAATRWPKDKIPIELWTFAVKHAVHTWNRTPREDLKFQSPEEVFTGLTSRTSRDNAFKYMHPFGCPAYVLDAHLSDGKRIPRWNPRARTGIFLGYSDEHASSVSLILNPDTDHISPQYNVIHDDKFETCHAHTHTDSIKTWDGIWKQQKISFTDFDFSLPLPDFASVPDSDNPPPPDPAPATSLSSAAQKRMAAQESHSSLQRGSSPSPPDDYDNAMSHRSKDLGSIKASASSKTPRKPKVYDPSASRPPVPGATRRSGRKKKQRKLFRAHVQALVAQATPTQLHSFNEKVERLLSLSSLDDNQINHYEPHALVASANPNILGHRDAMKADDFEKFLDSMDDEMERLFKEEIIEVVPRSQVPEGQKVLRAVWSHRRKTTPDGVVYRHRSRICADGSQQTYGMDYTETYAPVVNWTTVRILLTLSIVFGFKSRQVDYVQAFPQAPLPDSERVFMEIPAGYKYEGSNSDQYVIRLKKNLYGLKQAAYNWNVMLTEGLKANGFKQSKHDSCLFFKKDIVCCIYVDDTLFFSRDTNIIDKTINEMKDLNFNLTDEGQVEAFLGVKMTKHEDGSIKMSQPALISTILKLVGIEEDTKDTKGSKPLSLPAVNPPLHRHTNGAERERSWSYRSAIGLLTYLARNTRPDIEFAVHQCARFQCGPKKAHENAVMRIARYLKGTSDQGLILRPDKTKLNSLDVYVDADFAGAYTSEDHEDPTNVKSRTGCVIHFANCPIHWFSRLQTEIALSTTEAEYMALSVAAREVLPLRELMLEITSHFGLPQITPNLRCTIFEDNKGAEQLARAPRMRPRTKHIAIKYHHFREQVAKGILHITRVATDEQRADILTKATPLSTLSHLRQQIQGWTTILTKIAPFSEGDQNLRFKLDESHKSDKGLKKSLSKAAANKQSRLSSIKGLSAFLSFLG